MQDKRKELVQSENFITKMTTQLTEKDDYIASMTDNLFEKGEQNRKLSETVT